MKTITRKIKGFLVATLFMSSTCFSQCPLGNSFGSAVAPTVPGVTQQINTCSFLGEYSTVSGLVAGSEYTINLTASNGALGNFVVSVYDATNSSFVTSGNIPFAFIPGNTGNYYLQWNGPNCFTETVCHVSSIALTSNNILPCAGIPNPGITDGPSNACSGEPFVISIQNIFDVSGITYMWQSSSDAAFTSNVTTLSSITTSQAIQSQSAPTYYRCVVTCANETTPGYSSVLFVDQNSPAACYCTPVYQYGCTDQDIITQVSLNTLLNNSGTNCTSGNLGYVDYTNDPALTTALFYGQTYNLDVSVGLFSQGIAAWIDFNDDGIFETPSERIGYGTVTGNNTISLAFDINNAMSSGIKKMRIRSVFGGGPEQITSCGQFTWGETEDYSVLIGVDDEFACINGSVFCDNNDDGILDSSDVALGYAPFILNYNGQTQITNADVNGYFFFGIPLDSNATSATVTVDPAWLAQNGIQYTTNSITTTNLVCNANSPTLNFAVNCDSSDIQSSCIIGLVYCDANLNDSLDSGEVVIPFAPVVLENGVTVYTDSLGVFSYSGGQNPSGMMGVSISSSWLATNGYELLNNNFEVSTDCSSPVPLNIGINCSPVLCSNLWTTVTPWIGYFQNQNNQIRLSWGNYGPNMTSGFTLTLTFPTDVTPVLSSISNPNYSISGNTISWTYPAGNYSSYNTDIISFYVPPIFPSGTAHTYTSTIDARGAVADCDTTNNDGMLTMILGNSYDPNDKSVSHPPMINPDEDEELTYVIRFQNTGTAPAQDVYILDTLSSFLDWSSLKVINASHYMQLVDLGNGVVKFNFPGIWLPDSTSNEPASHGRVVFSIKENAFNPLNSVIENTGYIYFDWNEAIITNTTYNINAYPVSGIDELSGNQVNIYPNPFNGTVNVLSSKLMESIKVLDVTGHEVYFEAVNAVNQSIDLSKLSQGVYLVEVNSGGEISTQRIIKK